VNESSPLDGIRLKLYRAVDHFRDIDVAIGEMFRSENKAKAAGHHYDPDREELIVSLPKQLPIDPRITLIIGDCIHNVRSALDHLVFQLAILNRAEPEAASSVSFPVYLTSGQFRNATKGKIEPFIDASAFTEIKKLQPYETGDGVNDILWVLSQLDIFDKHRLFIVAKHKMRPTAFSITSPSGNFATELSPEGKWKTAEDGAEIIRFRFSGLGQNPAKMQVKVGVAETIQIEQTGLICDGEILLAVLSDCINYASAIVNHFGRLFFAE
jgi:hypothetical protein